MSYIITHYPVSEQVYNQLYSIALTKYSQQLVQPALHFLGHLLNSTGMKIRRDEEPIIPIPYTELYKILKVSRGATEPLWKGWLELDLIEVLPEQDKICRRYIVTDKLISLVHPTTVVYSSIRYNLCTGKKILKLEKSQKYDENKHPLNPLATTFFDNVSPMIISTKTLDFGRTMFLNNKRKQLALTTCIDFINAKSIMIDSDTIQYKPTYRMQHTGRIYEIGGGGQACSNSFKEHLFKGYYNYDLKASQLNIFRWYLERAQIEHDWLIKYVTDPAFKQSIITQSAISANTFKVCLIAILMGSNFNEDNKVMTYIREDKPDITKKEIAVIKDLLKPLQKIISTWNSYLIKSFIKDNLIATKKGKCIKNKIDKNFYLDDLWNVKTSKWFSKLPRCLTAHLLQGYESYYIFVLSSILFKIGIEIVSAQHDGIITKQLIPATAIKQANLITGYQYAEMVIKPFT
jgi:hypothetical protein